MKIACVGGGPGCLYFALLTKKRAPHHEITIYERNTPTQTFGWGVVFSDETLGYLEENDAESQRLIKAGFAHWDAIDVFLKGVALRSGGHGFSGIARKHLLQILQDRCIELGITIKFETEIDDIEALRQSVDLLVAGDGVNSKTRGLYGRHVRPVTGDGQVPIYLARHLEDLRRVHVRIRRASTAFFKRTRIDSTVSEARSSLKPTRPPGSAQGSIRCQSSRACIG
ncbi:MAG: hypothetical protein U0165_18245 [Polyangiaceae bacterium]